MMYRRHDRAHSLADRDGWYVREGEGGRVRIGGWGRGEYKFGGGEWGGEDIQSEGKTGSEKLHYFSCCIDAVTYEKVK